MQHKTTALNGAFGLMIEGVTRSDIEDSTFQNEVYDLWTDNGGLVAVRGADLAEASPAQFMTLSSYLVRWRTRALYRAGTEWCRARQSCASVISKTRPLI